MGGKRVPVCRESLVDLIGRTPLVRLNFVTAGIPAGVEIWAKLEYLNPGGSIKDRAARRIVLDALDRGDLSGGRRLLDATTGNVGVAYAMLGAALQFGVTLVVPEGTPQHLIGRIELFGAQVIESSPTDGINGAIELATEIAGEHPDQFWFADQHSNPSNPAAHHSTGSEIWEQTEGRVTHLVAGLGSSGSYIGMARALQVYNPDVRVYCAESVSGPDAVAGLRSLDEAAPAIFDPTVGDGAFRCVLSDADTMAKRLAAEEGIAAGLASGATVWVALQLAAELESATIVAIVGDHFDRGI